jgi:hypothetical protein
MGNIKRYAYFCVHIVTLKTFSEKSSCKTHKGKDYNVMHLNVIVYGGSHSKSCKSLNLLIPMSLTHLSKIAKDNDFIDKSA